ncbi:MAG: NADH-quinone oxidoreductase subunit L, partial [Terriglobia bacterium]
VEAAMRPETGGADSTPATHHPHESPSIMTGPLTALAVLSLAGGWVGSRFLFGESDPWSRFMAPAFQLAALPAEQAAGHSAETEHLLMALSLLVSLAGIGLAFLLYQMRPAFADLLQVRFRRLYQVVLNKYFVDEFYRFAFVRPIVAGSSELLWKAMDMAAIDGTIHLAARRTRRVGDTMRRMQSGNIRSYAGWVVLGAILLISFLVMWVS